MTMLKSGALGGVLSGFPEHARLIGQLITEWNTIEHALVLLLSSAMGQAWDITHQMVYALRNSSARIDVMEPALLHFYPQTSARVDDLRAIIKEARSVSKARNKYAHALYAVHAADGKLSMLNLEDGIVGLKKQENSRILEIKELEDAVWRSSALSNRLTGFMLNQSIEEPPK
ncbi:MAG TPA: hypothetical protein VIF38_13745, partial [Burkholderiales bacterium]